MTELRTDNGISFLITGYGERDMTDQSQSAREMKPCAVCGSKTDEWRCGEEGCPRPSGEEEIMRLRDEVATLRLAAQAAPGEPVAWREIVEQFIRQISPYPCAQLYELDGTTQVTWHVSGSEFFTLDFTDAFQSLATPAALPQDGRDHATIEALESAKEFADDEFSDCGDLNRKNRISKLCDKIDAALSSKGK